jgi:1-phosphatidylinositol-4-phosphate 5-kinase
VKRLEHLWKGLSHDRNQISPIPPEAYGDRFIKFMTGITMTKEEAERRGEEEGGQPSSAAEAGSRAQRRGRTTTSIDGTRSSRDSADPGPRSPAIDKTMQKAYKQAEKSEKRRSSKEEPPERTFSTVRSPSAERTHGSAGTTLPIVEEAGEAGSTGGRSRRSDNSGEQTNEKGGEYSKNPRPDITNTAAEIRRVPLEEGKDAEGYDRSASFFPDVPGVQPVLSASPPPMDPEKSLGSMMDQRPSLEGRYTR